MDAPRIRPASLSDGVSPDDEAAELEETRSETYFTNALRSKTILVAEGDGALVGYVQFGDGAFTAGHDSGLRG